MIDNLLQETLALKYCLADKYQDLNFADKKEIQLNMDFEPGDMQFLNNYQILHDRKEFKDWPNGENKRHLLRLWLCSKNSRKLHPIYLNRQDSIKVGDRGGILVPGTKMNVNYDLGLKKK